MSARRAPRERPDAPTSTGPVRTCVVCRTSRPSAELVRLVVASGTVVLDARRRLPGRGANVCPACLSEATGRRAASLRRALRAPDVVIEPLQLSGTEPGEGPGTAPAPVRRGA